MVPDSSLHLPSGYCVRLAGADDLPHVAPLAARLVRLHHALDPLRFLCVDDLERGYLGYFRRELPSPSVVILVAEGRDGGIAGYAYGRLEPRDWNDLLESCGKLHDLFVDEAARGKGVAAALVREMTARLSALGAPRVVLLTAAANHEAIALFEQLGFRHTMIEMTREAVP